MSERPDIPRQAVEAAPRRVQLKRTKGWRMPENTVRVARPSKWGNPFPIDHEGTAMHCLSMGIDSDDRLDRAAAAVDLYRRWLTNGKVNELVGAFLPPFEHPPILRHIQRDLGGKNLACWCKDGPCHADVLLELANGPPLHPGDGKP